MPPPSVPGFIVTPSRMMAVGADRQRRRLALVLEVLRLMADRGERKDARARADRGAAGDDDVADQLDALAELDLGADHAERARSHAGAELGAVLDDRRRVNFDVSHSCSQMPWRRRSQRSWR